MRQLYAVIDTNVLVSALYAKNPDSATFQVIEKIFAREIIPMYNDEILQEYGEVLRRPKFSFLEEDIKSLIESITDIGQNSWRAAVLDNVSDPKDAVFYEVALSRDDSYLVTGNIKHFPKVQMVVTPREILDLLSKTLKEAE